MSITTLITGTTRGIGNKLCKHLLDKNHKIISISRSELSIVHKNLSHLKIDITHPDCSSIIRNAIINTKVDNCIINAGVYNNSFFHKMSYNDWVYTLNTNLLSIHNVLNPVLNNMRDNNKGNVLFMSSIVGQIGLIGASNYSCSKSAIGGLTKSLALENARKNILINSISPGYINEGMGNELNLKNKLEVCERIPLNRFGEIDDIINIVDFMIEKNKYITGSNINISGGL